MNTNTTIVIIALTYAAVLTIILYYNPETKNFILPITSEPVIKITLKGQTVVEMPLWMYVAFKIEKIGKLKLIPSGNKKYILHYDLIAANHYADMKLFIDGVEIVKPEVHFDEEDYFAI